MSSLLLRVLKTTTSSFALSYVDYFCEKWPVTEGVWHDCLEKPPISVWLADELELKHGRILRLGKEENNRNGCFVVRLRTL